MVEIKVMKKKETTLEDFKKYYQEYCSNFVTYRCYDLNFEQVCYMKYGIREDEFRKLILQKL